MDDWDNFVSLSNVVQDDDLFVVISARRTSISYSSDLEAMPNILSRYFNHSNLLVIYPEQFGAVPNLESFSDPIAVDIDTQPTELLLGAKAWWREFKSNMLSHFNRSRS